MLLIEDFKEDINNSLKEIQESMSQQVNSKEITKGDNTEDRKPWKEFMSHRCKYQQQNIRDRRISGAEVIIESIDSTVKENAKCKNLVTQNI